MIYREFLVMRKALLWFFAIVVAFELLLLALTLSSARHHAMTNADLASIAVPGAWVASIFAAIFGVALGNGSREPSRVLWVVPQPRWRTALDILTVDTVGLTIAYAGVIVLSTLYFVAMSLFEPTVLSATVDWNVVLKGWTLVFAVYGWSAACGMAGRRMAYAGIISLPFLLMWYAFAGSGGAFGASLRAPIVANPFALYMTSLVTESARTRPRELKDAVIQTLLWTHGWTVELLALTALVACAIAVLLWQRSEVVA